MGQGQGDAPGGFATVVNGPHDKVCTTHVVTASKDARMICLMWELAALRCQNLSRS